MRVHRHCSRSRSTTASSGALPVAPTPAHRHERDRRPRAGARRRAAGARDAEVRRDHRELAADHLQLAEALQRVERIARGLLVLARQAMHHPPSRPCSRRQVQATQAQLRERTAGQQSRVLRDEHFRIADQHRLRTGAYAHRVQPQQRAPPRPRVSTLSNVTLRPSVSLSHAAMRSGWWRRALALPGNLLLSLHRVLAEGGEEDPDLARGGLGRVGPVHQVFADLEREVAADAAGGRLHRVSGADQPARGLDGPRPSATSATSGPPVMNSTSSPKNGFSLCSP